MCNAFIYSGAGDQLPTRRRSASKAASAFCPGWIHGPGRKGALNFQSVVGTEQLGPFVPVGYTGRDERGHLAVTGPPTPFVPVGYTGRDERVLTGRDELVPYASEDSGRRGRAICRGPGSGRDKRGRTKGPFSTSVSIRTSN